MPNTSTLDGFVQRMRLHSHVSDSDEAAILALPFLVIARDQFAAIMREGDETEFCFVVLSGMAERHRLDQNGGKQILAFYIAGDPLNLDHLFLDLADDDLRSVRATRLAAIRRGDLIALMAARRGVSEAALRIFAVDSSVSREWTVNVGQRDAETRIAHLLCELQVRGGNARGSERPWVVSQYNIAEATGLTPVHVNRTLKAMQRRGLLASGRSGISVGDWGRLEEVGGFDRRYLHLRANAD